MNPHDEQKLRDLLDDAVSDVEPRHGLDAITSRTKVSSMSTRPWLYGVGGAVLATAATIAAFAVLDEDPSTTSTVDPVDSPSVVATQEPTQEPSEKASQDAGPSPDEAPPAGDVTVPVYYAGQTGQGPRLYREFHQARGVDEDSSAAEAVQDALGVPADDPDYRTLWPEGSEVQRVERQSDLIVVDLMDAGALHDRPAGMTEREAQVALEQVVYTVQGVYQDRAPVRFLLDGKITDTVLGVPTSEPVAQGDETATLAQVWIIEPGDGATVDSGFRVSGVGAFFEANVVWELRQGDKVVKSGYTTAEECCRMAPYSFTVKAPAGDYLLVVKDQDMSDGEGFEPFQDTKRVTIR